MPGMTLAEAVALIAIAVTLLVALTTIARENRYRFVDRKLDLYTALIQEAEARHDAIRWQLQDQWSASERRQLVKDAVIREVGPGAPMERARSAIRLATNRRAVDEAAERLLTAASDLGQVAYIKPGDDEVVPLPKEADWPRLEAAYTEAWTEFVEKAKADIETSIKLWHTPW